MAWNLALAAVPAVLAIVLFRRSTRRTPLWWALFGVWFLFLPNAPYVLTDVVHMLDDLRASPTRLHGMAVLTSYGVFVGAGVVAYTFAMQRSRLFWHSVLPDRLVPLALVALHGCCVAAMWIGHYRRVNSWDAVVAPRETAESFLHVPSAFTMGVLFAMFVGTGAAVLVTKELGTRAVLSVRR
jgi:uncharacterized membrane protein